MKDEKVRPTSEMLNALESFGYKRDVTETWSAARATAVLRGCKRDAEVALRRAARAMEGDRPEPAAETIDRRPPGPERLAAADYLEGCVNPDDVMQGVWSCVGLLSNAQAKAVRDAILLMLREESGDAN